MQSARWLPLIGLIALAGCGGGGGGDEAKTFDESNFGITFEYPSEMKQTDDVSIARSAGNTAKATEGFEFTRRDLIIVQRYDLSRDIGEDDLDLAKSELDRLVTGLAGSTQSGKTGKVGGLPSVEYDYFDLREPKGARTRLISLFDGDRQYLFNCQYRPDRKEDIEKACDEVLESVKKK